MEISTVLLLLTGLALGSAAFPLIRAPARQVLDWWVTLALVGCIATGAFVLLPQKAGYVAFASMLALVFAPLRIDREAQSSARAGRDARALTLARLAAVLHPFGSIAGHRATLAALSKIRTAGAVDDAILATLGATHDPITAEWYRLLALHAAADEAGLRAALLLPSRRVRMIRFGLGPAWVRAIADTGDRAAILAAIEEAERHDRTLDDPDRRAQLALEICAALGDVEGTRAIGDELEKKLPRGSIARATAAAHLARGESDEARRAIDAALATELDPAIRRSIERLRTHLDDPKPEPTPWLEGRVRELLTRVRREAHATAALSPLTGGGSTPWATWALAAAIVGWYFVVAFYGDTMDPKHLERMGGLVLPIDGVGSALRLFSSTLVHYGVLHLVFNVYALVAFGRFVESFYGRARFFVIYLAATITSGLGVAAGTAAGEHHVLVGASGAIFGLGGALVSAVVLDPELRRSQRGRDELKSFGVLVAIQFLFDRLVPKVSGTAHVAGLVGGIVAGAILLAPRRIAAAR